MSHGIPNRVRETTLQIRHPGGFGAPGTCERRAHGVALRCAQNCSLWSRFANAIRALASRSIALTFGKKRALSTADNRLIECVLLKTQCG